MGVGDRIADWVDEGRQHVRSHPWLFVVAVLILLVFVRPAWSKSRFSNDEIMTAIRMVESGGNDQCADGDGGRAIGPFQIHRVYWRDAVDADPNLGPDAGHDYQDCRERAYARKIVEAYMRRWVPEAWEANDAEVIARTHNGGPKGAGKRATDKYWSRVLARLEDG